MNIPREKIRKTAKWVMLAGMAGTVVFAGTLAMELAKRKRDEAYYASMSAYYVEDQTDQIEQICSGAVSVDLLSADKVIE